MFIFVFYLVVSYLAVINWILLASSLWTLYFVLELQWMLLTIFLIVGSAVWRGLLNYLILNGILSTLFIISLLLNNYVLFIFGILFKLGFFPYFLILSYQYCSSSYYWIIFDLFNKWAYFGGIIFSIYFGFILSFTFSDWYVLINFLMIVFLIRFVLSMKHFILISSLQLFLFIIIWDCQGYTGGAYYVLYFNDYFLYFNDILSNSKHFSSYFYWSTYYFYLFPYLFTDLTSMKELVKINSILYILYIFYCFTFFPTILFLLKLFILFSFISSSLYFSLVLIVYIIFSLQSFYLRSLCFTLRSAFLNAPRSKKLRGIWWITSIDGILNDKISK